VVAPPEEEGLGFMNVIRKIALPCGLVGGIWGLLAPILVLLPITARGVTPPVAVEQGENEKVSQMDKPCGVITPPSGPQP